MSFFLATLFDAYTFTRFAATIPQYVELWTSFNQLLGRVNRYYRKTQTCISNEDPVPKNTDRVLAKCDAKNNTNDDPEAKQYVTKNSKTHVIRFDLNVGAKASVTINRGDTVRWEWSGLSHDVRAGVEWALNSKFGCMPSPTGSYSHTFAFTGLYPYLCTLHPKSMVGVITVESKDMRQCKLLHGPTFVSRFLLALWLF